METRLVVARVLGEWSLHSYKKSTQDIFVVLELFSAYLTVDIPTSAGDKTVEPVKHVHMSTAKTGRI